MKYTAISRSRIWFFYGGVSLSAVVLIVTLFFVQVVDGEKYREQAESQYIAPVTGLFDRGSIFFTDINNQTFSAARVRSGVVIAINPSIIENPEKVFKKLSMAVEINREDFFEKANKKDDPYEVLLSRVEKNTGELVRNMKIKGVVVSRDRWRYYPMGTTSAQTLGFVGYKQDIVTGRYGLEQHYNHILERGDPKPRVNFFAEIFTNISTILVASNEREGDIITHIEPRVQGFLESAIDNIKTDWDADAVGGVIMDPKTGAIYAIAYVPSFNPNTFNLVSDASLFSNPIVGSVYEMGSIIKALTIAAGLDAGVIDSSTTFNDTGTIVLNNRRVGNHDGRAHGVVTMQEAINKSLNTGSVFIMQQLGKEKFKDYFLSFGIGEETGIDLPNEVHGLISNLNSKHEIEYATASFGQGIAMTPIATIRALASLGNGGLLVTPHIVRAIDYGKGNIHTISPLPPERVFSPETSEEVTRMLVNVVDEALLYGAVKLPNYSVAAKTGTAQIAKTDEAGYYKHRHMHTFFGYFPAYDPEFIVLLFAIDPKKVRYASQTLTHPFMDITKFLINYYDIPPDR